MPKIKYKTEHQKMLAIKKSQSEYQKRAWKTITIRYHLENDKAVIDAIEKAPNKADYIRQLILADINKGE